MEETSISFRPLERSHFPLLQEWLAAPHVSAWWNERNDLATIETKYSPLIDGVQPTHVFVILQESRPIGWIQWYLWADYEDHARQLGAESSTAGIDLAIGDVSMTGVGWGPIIIREFLNQFVFTNSSIRAVVTDPDERNFTSVRAFKKAGFSVVNTLSLAGESCRRHVMRLDSPLDDSCPNLDRGFRMRHSSQSRHRAGERGAASNLEVGKASSDRLSESRTELPALLRAMTSADARFLAMLCNGKLGTRVWLQFSVFHLHGTFVSLKTMLGIRRAVLYMRICLPLAISTGVS